MKNTKQWVRTGIALAIAGSALCGASAAFAQVKIGVTLSATGPAASLGIPEKNTIALLPKEIGGKIDANTSCSTMAPTRAAPCRTRAS